MTDAAVIRLPLDEIRNVFGPNGEHWIQHSWGDTTTGPTCMHGGIRRCLKQPGDKHIIEQVAFAQGWWTSYNDTYGRTFDEVWAKIEEHAEILPRELKEVFGPQWVEIVALVRRTATLTAAEAESLRTARGAAWDAAWDTAWDTARVAARGAASDTASALVVRDLIGQHGYTQEHYDKLTGPWRQIIGPVHPDDKPLGEDPQKEDGK